MFQFGGGTTVGKVCKPWFTRLLVHFAKKKKEAHIPFRKMNSDRAAEECKECGKGLEQGIKRTKRGLEMP